jgi:hypothetical protein
VEFLKETDMAHPPVVVYKNILSEYPSTWDYFWTKKMKYGI